MLHAFASGRLFGTAFGTGPPRVLALPGWTRDHGDFAAVLSGFDAIALDPPGFGTTPAPSEGWGSPQYAEAVAPVLAEMADPVVILGHSFGGRVAVHLAASHPERVGGLVLTGVPLVRRPGPPPALRYRIGRWLNKRGVLSEPAMQRLRERYWSEDYRRASGVMRDVFVKVVAESYEAQLRAITCPVELVVGENDTAAPPAVARAAADLVANANVTVVPGVGHFTPIKAPDALRAAVERLLR